MKGVTSIVNIRNQEVRPEVEVEPVLKIKE